MVDLASLEIRLERSENLPVLPQAISSVMQLVDDPNTSSRQVEKIIERDPGVTAKILRVANSAYYGLPKVKSIERAVSFLGMNTLRSVVMSVAFQNLLKGRGAAKKFCRISFWQHSLATATACRILGRLKMPQKAEELYCAGMIHDVGLLVLDRFDPAGFDKAIQEATETGNCLIEAENRLLGYNHYQAGVLLADKWGLSSVVKNAIRYHHDPKEDGEYYDTTAVVAIANHLANRAGCSNNIPESAEEISDEVTQAIGLDPAQLPVIEKVVATEVKKAQAAFKL